MTNLRRGTSKTNNNGVNSKGNKSKMERIFFDTTLFNELNRRDELEGEYVIGQRVFRKSSKKVVFVQTKVNNSNMEVCQSIEAIMEKNIYINIKVNTWDKEIDGLQNKHYNGKLRKRDLFFDPTLFKLINANDDERGEYVVGQSILKDGDKTIHIQTKVNNSNMEVNQAMEVSVVDGKEVVQLNTWDKYIGGLDNMHYSGRVDYVPTFDVTLFSNLNMNDEEKGEFVFGQFLKVDEDGTEHHIQTKVLGDEEFKQEVIVKLHDCGKLIQVNTWDKEIEGTANKNYINNELAI